MEAVKFLDRLLTIIATATITSVVWIVVGGSIIENAGSASQRDTTRPAEAAPSPNPPVASRNDDAANSDRSAPGGSILDTDTAQRPETDEQRQLLVPVLNVRPSDLTDTYSDSRGGGSRLHEAIDIMAPTGTSVVAASAGTVEKLFSSDAGGLTIYVRLPQGRTIHYYAHLDEYAEGLREGQRVRRGQRLGTVGSTGNASPDAPHLHFAVLRTTPKAEWWEPANAVNPYPLLAD